MAELKRVGSRTGQSNHPLITVKVQESWQLNRDLSDRGVKQKGERVKTLDEQATLGQVCLTVNGAESRVTTPDHVTACLLNEWLFYQFTTEP